MSDQIPMSEAVRHLMAMNEEVVSAKYIAPILRMSESVIVKYAKDGTWDQDHLGKFVISGGHVKFFRKDFLQKCGFMEPEPEEKTVMQMLDEISTKMDLLLGALTAMMNQDQRREFVETWADDEKTAGAATPTD